MLDLARTAAPAPASAGLLPPSNGFIPGLELALVVTAGV
jgi:hypothetical protein